MLPNPSDSFKSCDIPTSGSASCGSVSQSCHEGFAVSTVAMHELWVRLLLECTKQINRYFPQADNMKPMGDSNGISHSTGIVAELDNFENLA